MGDIGTGYKVTLTNSTTLVAYPIDNSNSNSITLNLNSSTTFSVYSGSGSPPNKFTRD